MITQLLKSALPFTLTLIVGTGLGSIFGLHKHGPGNSLASRIAVFDQLDTGRHSCRRHKVAQLRIDYQPATRYTPEARDHQITGVVTLLVQFNPDGTTTVVDRLSTLPDGLTEDAERVAAETRFTPARVSGKPTSETREVNYIYTLPDRETIER